MYTPNPLVSIGDHPERAGAREPARPPARLEMRHNDSCHGPRRTTDYRLPSCPRAPALLTSHQPGNRIAGSPGCLTKSRTVPKLGPTERGPAVVPRPLIGPSLRPRETRLFIHSFTLPRSSSTLGFLLYFVFVVSVPQNMMFSSHRHSGRLNQT